MAPTLAELALRLNRRRPRRLPGVVLMTDPRVDPLPLVDKLPPGSAVVLRHYGRPERLVLGRTLAAECRRRRLIFLVAMDVRLAAQLRADGLHLPEWRVPRPPAMPRRNWIVSAAAHSLPALLRARRLGADWAMLSPVSATVSHPGAATLGPRRFATLARKAGLPVMALGGVNVRTVRFLRGASGVATVSGL